MNFNSVSNKNWVSKKYNNQEALLISERFSLKEITSRLLSIRNVDLKNIEPFLKPTIKNTMPNPDDISDMNKAVDRMYSAISKKQIVGIFGDYDVDGASSTALLAKYLFEIGQKYKTFIPDRQKDGYGPSIDSFHKLINDGSNIIITVDCGTSSFDAVEYAQKKNIDVIILDHHQSDTILPKAHSIVNPNRIDDNSDLNYLCATGVTFMFLVALNKKLRESNWFKSNNINEPNILNFLDLVCLGTICDVVPLIGLNRAIVAQGLKILKKRSNLGLKTLYDMCEIQNQPTPYHVGYLIGPRINAGGRVGKSFYGAELLMSNNSQYVYEIATKLNDYNNQRKEIEKDLLIEASKIAEQNLKDPILVLSGNDWHEGVIGIIASRIKDKYNKPTFIISIKKDISKGSARSIYGFDIGTSIIAAVQSGLLEKGGGHKMAGGFSIQKKKILKFKDFLIKRIEKGNLFNSNIRNLYFDALLSPSSVNETFLEDINLLAPFGSGNAEPIFVLEGLKVVNSKILSNKHIKVIMSARSGDIIECIAYNSINSPMEPYLNKSYNKELNIAGKIILNEWRGKKKVEFVISDIATK